MEIFISITLPDMIAYGIKYMSKNLAIQYGDGQANNVYWQDAIFWYNRQNKVNFWAQATSFFLTANADRRAVIFTLAE